MKKTYKPGEPAPESAQYSLMGPRGGNTGSERTVTKGERLPPTPKPGMRYEVADLTRH